MYVRTILIQSFEATSHFSTAIEAEALPECDSTAVASGTLAERQGILAACLQPQSFIHKVPCQ